jgi:phage protein D
LVGTDPVFVLLVNGADVTNKIHANSMSMSYTDNDGDEADSLSITVAGYWDKASFLDKVELWLGYASSEVWSVGSFTVQKVVVGAFSSTIEATSTNFNGELKEKKNVVHKNKSIKSIVEKIAKKQNLEVKCNVADKVLYLHQHKESDIHFLTRIAKERNAIFKIKKDLLIFLDRESTNTQSIAVSECYGDGPTVTFSSRAIYASAEAEFWSSKDNENKTVKVGNGSPVLKVDEHFEDEEEARAVLKSELKRENSSKISGRLSIYGMDVVAGNKLKLDGDKRYEGLIFGIVRVTHTIDGSGFSTGLEFEG